MAISNYKYFFGKYHLENEFKKAEKTFRNKI